VIFEAATPSQTVMTVIAAEYRADVKYTAECVFLTTALSLVTLPLVYYIYLLAK
jgi:predicted permease